MGASFQRYLAAFPKSDWTMFTDLMSYQQGSWMPVKWLM